MAEAETNEELLQVLAELELVKRKAELLEKRLAAWEDRQAQALRTLDGLVGGRDPGDSPEEKLEELEHRVARLERRRAAEVAAAPQPDARPLPPPALDAPPAVAIVRARWTPEDAKPGSDVALVAQVDGIPTGTSVPISIYSVADKSPLYEVVGTSDGDLVRAVWKIPEDIDADSLYFRVGFDDAEAESSVLYL